MTDREVSAARSQAPPEPERRGSWRKVLREVAFGMVAYDFVRHAQEERDRLNTVFLVLVLGDALGLPILPPYHALRLLPFVVPEVDAWKRRVLRERDLTEDHELDLHGI